MPLSLPVSRSLRHTRAITVEAYARDDGLWDLDASIRDVKTRDIQLPSGDRPAGASLKGDITASTREDERTLQALDSVFDTYGMRMKDSQSSLPFMK